MSTYSITYDLNSPGQNHSKLLSGIKKHFIWARLSESTYAVNTRLTPQQVYELLSPFLDGNDTLYVINLSRSYFGQGHPEVNDWLNKNLTF